MGEAESWGDRDAEDKARHGEQKTRRSALQSIADPKVRGELELRIGQSNFWEVYDKRTAPPKDDDKAPTRQVFPDGSLRQWDPDSKSWSVLGTKPADGEEGLLDDATRRRLKGGLEAGEDARKAALKRADDEIAEIRKKNDELSKGKATDKSGKPVALDAVPDRLTLARKYETEELAAARYRLGTPSPPAGRAPDASQAPTSRAGEPAKAAPATATQEQAKQLAALIEKRVAALRLPPTAAIERKAQILARARKALADGVPPDQILQELQ